MNFLCQTDAEIDACVAQGILPGTVLALHAVWSAHRFPAAKGWKLFIGNFGFGLLLSFVPPVVNLVLGVAPWGTTPLTIAIHACQHIPFGFYYALVCLYLWACAKLAPDQEGHYRQQRSLGEEDEGGGRGLS